MWQFSRERLGKHFRHYLGIPSALAATVQLYKAYSSPSLGLLIGGSACLFLFGIFLIDWLLDLAARRHLACLTGYVPTEQQASHYKELVVRHRRVQKVTLAEAQARTGLTKRQLRILFRTPDFYPRPEVLKLICDLFLVPLSWLDGRDDYGPECTVGRARRYLRVCDVSVDLKHAIRNAVDSSDYEIIEQTVRLIEEVLGIR